MDAESLHWFTLVREYVSIITEPEGQELWEGYIGRRGTRERKLKRSWTRSQS
jgi:hypothetical protein